MTIIFNPAELISHFKDEYLFVLNSISVIM